MDVSDRFGRRAACQLRPHDGQGNTRFTLLVLEVFVGVSGVVPSRRGRTGNRGAPSERGSSFSYPPICRTEPSSGKQSMNRSGASFSMAHDFHCRQERSHFLLRHRPTSAFPRHGNPRTSKRGARLKATSRVENPRHGHVSTSKSHSLKIVIALASDTENLPRHGGLDNPQFAHFSQD